MLQKTTRIISILFFLSAFTALISPLAYWYLIGENLSQFSIYEQRELSPFLNDSILNFKMAVKRLFQLLPEEAGELFFNQFFNHSFQLAFSEGVRDQFPLRIEQIQFNRGFERMLISAAYFFVKDQAIPADLESNYLITRDQSTFLKEAEVFAYADQKNIDFRIRDYQEFIENYPEINLYVYSIQTAEFSDWHPHSKLIPDADSGRSLQYFLNKKPAQLEFMSFDLKDFSDYQKYFFSTDHHWNIHGALKGYREIYKMLSEKYMDISPLVEITTVKPMEGVDLLGSIARLTLYPIEPDRFETAEYELPPYKTYRDGEEIFIGRKNAYEKGNFPDRKYENHYRQYYGWNREIVVYKFENNSDRNLLMITSSHAICIQDLIASHYKEAVVADHRAKYFLEHSIDELIDQYDIDDIIILGQPSLTYLSKDFLLSGSS